MNRDESIIAQSSAHDAATIVAAMLARTDPATSTDQAAALRDQALDTFEWFRDRIMARTLEIGGAGGGGSSKAADRPAVTGDESDPGAMVIQLPRHRGETIAEVHEKDPSYLTWALENGRDAKLKKAIRAFLGLDEA